MKLFAKPFNSIAVIIGGFLIVLICADFFVQVNGQTFENSVDANVAEKSSLPLFFIGLIAGVLSGIAMFFVYIVRREKKQQAEQSELALLFDEVSRDDTVFNEEDWFANSEFSESLDDNTQALDPWERGADWWKSDE